jgi:hypothetical protein
MKEGTVLVACGTSCREQVKHFTGVTALHPATLLRSLLTSEISTLNSEFNLKSEV